MRPSPDFCLGQGRVNFAAVGESCWGIPGGVGRTRAGKGGADVEQDRVRCPWNDPGAEDGHLDIRRRPLIHGIPMVESGFRRRTILMGSGT